MNYNDLWPSDRSKIGEWERKNRDRDRFTTKEAACFLEDNHPALSPSRATRNAIDGLSYTLEHSIEKDDNGDSYLEGHPQCGTLNGKPLFKREAYFDWSVRNKCTLNYEPEKLDWFKGLKPKVLTNKGELLECDFLQLIKDTPEWNKWNSKGWYTPEEAAYLIAGYLPTANGFNEDRKSYRAFIEPVLKEIESAANYDFFDFECKGLPSLEDIKGRYRGNDSNFPEYCSLSYYRFCRNGNHKWQWPFGKPAPQAQPEASTEPGPRPQPFTESEPAPAAEAAQPVQTIAGFPAEFFRRLMDPADRFYSEELHLALRVKLSFFERSELESGTAKQTIEKRLNDIKPGIKIGACNRIATLCNWDKDGTKYKSKE